MTKEELNIIEARVKRVKYYDAESGVYYQNDIPILIAEVRRLQREPELRSWTETPKDGQRIRTESECIFYSNQMPVTLIRGWAPLDND